MSHDSHDSIVSRISHQNPKDSPPKRGRWWNELDPDFYKRDVTFDLGLKDRLQVAVTAAGDVVTRTLAATLVGATALPFGFSPARIRGLEEEGEFYGALAEKGDRASIFVPPEHGVSITRT